MIGLYNLAKAQKKPFFEFTLYAEDSRGHKDSVVIGYAKNVDNTKALDSSYIDRGISTKFDSVFEIRAHRYSYIYVQDNLPLSEVMTKHLTLKYLYGENECNGYNGSYYAYIAIKTKYPPVKFYWDNKVFNDDNFPCIKHSYLNINEYSLQENNPDAPIVARFRNYLSKDSFRRDSFIRGTLPIWGWGWLLRYKDNSLDTLQGNFLLQFRNRLFTNLADIPQQIGKSYPNPCREQLNVLIASVKKESMIVNIHGVSGALMHVAHKFSDGIVSIDTSPLSIGHYVVEIITADNQRFISKFMKTD